jgi:hypothetical protein
MAKSTHPGLDDNLSTTSTLRVFQKISGHHVRHPGDIIAAGVRGFVGARGSARVNSGEPPAPILQQPNKRVVPRMHLSNHREKNQST